MPPPPTATVAPVEAPVAAPPAGGVADAAAAAVAAARAASAAAAAAAPPSTSGTGTPTPAPARAVEDLPGGRRPPLPSVTLSTILSIPELACLLYDHLAGVPFTAAPPADPDSPGAFACALTLVGAAAVAPLAATCRAARSALRPAVRTLSLSPPPTASAVAGTLLGGGGGGGGGGGSARRGRIGSAAGAAAADATTAAALSARRAAALGRLLRTFPALRCLSAVRAGWVDAPALAAVAASAPRLEALRLAGVPSLPASAVGALAALSRLGHLNLGYPPAPAPTGANAPTATPAAAAAASVERCAVVGALPALTSLSLSGHALSPGALAAVGSGGRLRRLWLTGASGVSPAAVRALASSPAGATLTHLWVAGVNGGHGVADAHVAGLAPAGALRELHLGHALSLTDVGLAAVAAAAFAPSLRVLVLEGGGGGAEGVTRGGVAALRAALPACELRIGVGGEEGEAAAAGDGGGWVDGWHP
ncbi:hypothetical protein I4F81_002632 [Pyropia yezoensis]|uniref:Uncharacterized protein n=1 Tax=Pyropia yezoensis TaxID=2788 RepID=A0ACC3BPX7_PYRYE|nr:hypothetical protein I4F81_002632 [Neopyropia yezoensis]